MKNTLLALLLIAFFNVQGQNLTVTVPVVTASIGQTVLIPVTLSGASSSGTPISSANIQISFDTAVLTYDTLTNFYSMMPKSQWFFAGNNGLVSANWLEPSLLTLAVPNNTKLYDIRFIKKAGSTPLTFVVYEFTDAAYNLVPTTAVNGAVNEPAVFRQVTFKVDMSKENITSSGVHLAGSFNNWSATQHPMTLNPNSIYTTTVTLQEGQDYQYRFVNGNTAAGMETVPASCGVANTSGIYERSLMIPAGDTTLNTVCFGMCTACPVNVNVTFRVDMQHVTVSPDGVHVAGTFNNWNYGQSLMNPAGGTIYEFSGIFEEGSYQEFLFVNGNTIAGAEAPPSTCTANNHRYMTIPGLDTVLTAYCFDSCVACGTVPQYYNVTFRVDMRNADTIAQAGIYIAGNFQGWAPGVTAMQTTGIDSIYSFTGSFLAGSALEYKFINGNTAAGYETIPLACAVNGSRGITVPGNDTLLMKVCFSTCDTCMPLTGIGQSQAEQGTDLLQNSPNPCDDYTRIGFTTREAGHVKITLFDFSGRTVKILFDDHRPAGSFHITTDTRLLKPGLYYYQMALNGRTEYRDTKKMVVVH
jgi:hypothetical protein